MGELGLGWGMGVEPGEVAAQASAYPSVLTAVSLILSNLELASLITYISYVSPLYS